MANTSKEIVFHGFMHAHFLYNVWFHFGLRVGIIFGAKFATILLVGRPGVQIGRKKGESKNGRQKGAAGLSG